MIKVLSISAAVVACTATLAFADVSGMQTGRSTSRHIDHHPMHHHRMLHGHMRHRGVAADGTCGGIHHGTGYGGCGTATGGPVGGIPGRH